MTLGYKLYDNIHRKIWKKKQTSLVNSDEVIDYLLKIKDEELLEILKLSNRNE